MRKSKTTEMKYMLKAKPQKHIYSKVDSEHQKPKSASQNLCQL